LGGRDPIKIQSPLKKRKGKQLEKSERGGGTLGAKDLRREEKRSHCTKKLGGIRPGKRGGKRGRDIDEEQPDKRAV